MKRIFVFCMGCYMALPAFSQSARKVLFVIADGIPADVLEKIHTPNLDEIARAGKYMRAHVGGDKGTYSETPTISAVGYNSLLTGTWVNKHNVWGNDIKAPDYRYWTIFRVLKTQYPAKKTAIFSSWTDNRTKLIGEGLPETGGFQLDWHYDGYELDTVNFPHDAARSFMHRIDEKVADEAAACVRKEAPDLSWVYLEYTDDMGHLHGDGPDLYSAVEKMDAQVGRIWKAIQYRQQHFKEDWLIIITTDHGRDEETGRDHGGQSPRQRGTWIVMNDPHVNDYARYRTPGIVDIMPTMARWLHLAMPVETEREVDGVPLIGKVSLAKPAVNVIQGKLDLTWQAFEPDGRVKIWVTTTNNFHSGGADDYRLLATVPVAQEHADVRVADMPSSFYKVLLEGPDNCVNVWVSPKGSGENRAAVRQSPAPVPSLLPLGSAWAAVYQQRAAEYEALCFQAYNTAREKLDGMLAAPPAKDRAPSAKDRAPSAGLPASSVLPPAIITDIDETLLDNSPYAVHQALRGETYSDSTWIAWTARVACDTVPGALTFLKYAASRGVAIFYVTNRLTVERTPTLQNLQKWGFPDADTQHLTLLDPGSNSSKETRREAVRDHYAVLMLLGDNLSDFSPVFDHQSWAARKERVESGAALFGGTFIVLPNPVYGDWEGALYDNQYPASLSARNQVLLDSLRTY
jgi:5'-nucleotidase (lipoprotein e(P4) family)